MISRMMLVLATLDTSFWPSAVKYAAEVVRIKALKAQARIMPFASIGKKGWGPKGTDGILMKAAPWSGEAVVLLEDGEFFRSSTRVPEHMHMTLQVYMDMDMLIYVLNNRSQAPWRPGVA